MDGGKGNAELSAVALGPTAAVGLHRPSFRLLAVLLGTVASQNAEEFVSEWIELSVRNKWI